MSTDPDSPQPQAPITSPPPEQPRPPSHRGQRSRRPLTSKRGILAALAAAVLAVSLFAGLSSRAGASTTPKRLVALEWAEHQAGKWYCWGGTGPSCFDCSGLVVAAYQRAGIALPRTTYEMLRSNALKKQTGHPKPGNLVFFGDGHVTLYYWRHVVLHAPEPGEKVQLTRWYPGSNWVPTGYYKIRDAGNGPMRQLRRWVHRMMTRFHLRIHQHTNLRDVFPHR